MRTYSISRVKNNTDVTPRLSLTIAVIRPRLLSLCQFVLQTIHPASPPSLHCYRDTKSWAISLNMTKSWAIYKHIPVKNIKYSLPLNCGTVNNKGYHQRTMLVVTIQCCKHDDFVIIYRHMKCCVAKDSFRKPFHCSASPWPHNMGTTDDYVMFLESRLHLHYGTWPFLL